MAAKKTTKKAPAKKTVKKSTKPMRNPNAAANAAANKRRFGKLPVTTASEAHNSSVVKIASGLTEVDHTLGGGLTVGEASEWFGPEGHGKTACAMKYIEAVQRQGGVTALLDFERSLDPTQWPGVDMDQLLWAAPGYMEEGFKVVRQMLDTLADDPPEGPSLIVWDTVAMAKAKCEVEADEEDATMAGQARVMSRQLNAKMLNRLHEARAHLLFINQVRDTMNAMAFAEKEHTPGGRTLKHVATQRLKVKRIRTVKEGDRKVGMRVQVTGVKMRHSPPFRQGNFLIRFDCGPDAAWSALDSLKERKLVRRAGPVFKPSDALSDALSGTVDSFKPDEWPGIYCQSDVQSAVKQAIRGAME